MDPKAALDQLVACLEDRDHSGAKQVIRELVAWFRKGGFAPAVDAETLEFLLTVLAEYL